ncbi:MAG: hypothetical protein SFU57_01190 [Gemmatimonadales bacterium]|nr:hypothetical protein [Gemmatimonadales bacterium]
MLRKILRLFLRLAGWLLTPIAALLAAVFGALLATLIAPLLSPDVGVVLTLGAAVIGATGGLWFWLRLVRRTPRLQAVLAVSADGVPTEGALEEFAAPHQSEDRSLP